MEGSASSNNHDPPTLLYIGHMRHEPSELHGVVSEVDPAPHRVGQGLRLLVYLLLHKGTVAT